MILFSAAVLPAVLASLLFIPFFNGVELVEIPDGMKGRAAALEFSRALGSPSARLFTSSYSAAYLMYGPAKPGCYRSGRTSAFGAMKALCRGDLAKVVITEGMTSSDAARIIARSLHMTADGEKSLRLSIAPSEGKLFPAIYPVRTRDPHQLTAAMEKKFSAEAGNFTRDELIIASIVQKEVKYRKDFRRCAGVIRNRLDRNMKLECDSIYQYVLGPVRVTKELIAKDSPYNTFLRGGLPPTPI